MAKKNLKKSTTKKKSQRAIQLEEEKKAAEAQRAEELEKKKQSQKRMMRMTKEVMLSVYSIGAAILSWLIDYMGIVALVAVILSVFGIRANRNGNRKYFMISVIALVISGARLVMELYGIFQAII